MGVQIPSSFSFIEERGQLGFDLTVVEQEAFHGSGKGLTKFKESPFPSDNSG
jgi:hypothetical protein